MMLLGHMLTYCRDEMKAPATQSTELLPEGKNTEDRISSILCASALSVSEADLNETMWA